MHRLPQNLAEALAAMDQSELAQQTLGGHVHDVAQRHSLGLGHRSERPRLGGAIDDLGGQSASETPLCRFRSV